MNDASEERVRVWEAMGTHFLDTETRHEIPRTELTCLEAGLSSLDRVAGDLLARYREPGRHHHGLAHVESCLAWLDWFASCATRFEEVELALWYYDAIYDPRRSDNECRSAELARAHLAELGVDWKRRCGSRATSRPPDVTTRRLVTPPWWSTST